MHIASVRRSGRFLDRPPRRGISAGFRSRCTRFAAMRTRCPRSCAARVRRGGGSVPHRVRTRAVYRGVRPARRVCRPLRQRLLLYTKGNPGTACLPATGLRLGRNESARGEMPSRRASRRHDGAGPENRAANGGAGTDGGALLDDRVGTDGRAFPTDAPGGRRSAVPCRRSRSPRRRAFAQVISRVPKSRKAPSVMKACIGAPSRPGARVSRTMQDGRPPGIRSSSSGPRSVPRVEPSNAPAGGAAEPRDPPIVPHAHGVYRFHVREKDRGASAPFVRWLARLSREGTAHRVGIGGHERSPAQVHPRIPIPPPVRGSPARRELHGTARRPRRHLLTDRLRPVVEVEENDSAPHSRRNAIACRTGLAQNRDDGSGSRGEGRRRVPKTRGEIIAFMPALRRRLVGQGDRIGRSLRDPRNRRVPLEKFPAGGRPWAE